ncbi:hypothetical protein CEXT_651231, partial [Caerostris extrusa]
MDSLKRKVKVLPPLSPISPEFVRNLKEKYRHSKPPTKSPG